MTFDVLHTTDLSTEMKTDKHEFYSDGYECFVDLEYSGGSAPSVTDFGKTPGQTGIHLTTLSFTDAVVEDVDTTVYHEIQQTGAQGQMGPVDINALQVGDVVEIHEKVSYFFSIKCSF
ncbi:MAG TPA: hypothetical protein EYQ63_29000 [Fuerstia sp.]|nr:hypothetical protein [Fuerstiella sp.]